MVNTINENENLCIVTDPSLHSDPSPSPSLSPGPVTEMVANESTIQIDECGINDIGQVVDPGKSDREICTTISNFSSSQKYDLLFNHTPPPSFLPSTFSHGCMRKFNIDWLRKYSWLRYSSSLNGVFCGPCSILLTESKRNGKGILVNKPFSNWVKISTTLKNHSLFSYHLEAVVAADALKTTTENPSKRIDVQTSTTLQRQVERNKHILRQIIRAVIYLGKQGLPFRGSIENVTSTKNPGNFLALLKIFAETDEVLQAHLESPVHRNVTYLSPTSQNELIEVMGYDIIRKGIVDEVQQAKYFSVMADEVTSHNVEHLPICLRFVDAHNNIREEFIAFIRMERVRAVDISCAIIATLEGLGLSLNNLRGQGYDGASTMSGEKGGVQKLIREKQPKALYTHCAGHSINLVITSSCSIPTVRNCIDVIKGMTLWIKHSPKREGLLKAIVQRGLHDSSQSRTPLLNVCVTRWVENIEGWERFALCHPFLIEMCEAIIFGVSDLPLYNDKSWTPDDKRNAMAHLKSLESFEFLYTLTLLHRSLMYLKDFVVLIQGESQDIVGGLELLSATSSSLQQLRNDVDSYSSRIYQHSCRIAEKSNIQITKPRICQRQQHRANVQTDSVEDYMKTTITIPFLDHLLNEISSRFDGVFKTASTIQSLVPTKLTSSSSADSITDAVTLYKDDLPNPLVVDEEFHIWKLKWLSVSMRDRPTSLHEILKQCSQHITPNLYTLLKIFATLPMTSCSCERSASALRRLNNYLRATQTEERLSALALIHCHYSTNLEIDRVAELFIQKHPRRLQHSSLLLPSPSPAV